MDYGVLEKYFSGMQEFILAKNSNMWPPHIDLAKAFFPNAKIIIHCIN